MFNLILDKQTKKVVSYGFGEMEMDANIYEKVSLPSMPMELRSVDIDNYKQYKYENGQLIELE